MFIVGHESTLSVQRRELYSSILVSPPVQLPEDMATNVKENLQESVKTLDYFSVALDESTDIQDTAQLAIFTRGS